MARRQPALSLFWRTFVLLLVLLVGGVFAWTQTFRALEFEPRAVQAAQQIASLVNLSRVALSGPDAISRLTIIKTASADAAVKFSPREPGDRWKPYEVDRFSRAIAAELRSRLGADILVARELNGVSGLWVGFQIEDDAYWLQADPTRLGSMATSTLLMTRKPSTTGKSRV
jgi:two-component system osmolarity sensor histidine kinase EnvZ